MQHSSRFLVVGFALLVGLSTAQAQVYTASLTGPKEAPPNASPATGSGTINVNPTAHTLQVVANFTGLTGLSTAAHIHCCTATPFTGTAGVATRVPAFIGFPIGVSSGSWDSTDNMTLAPSFNAAFITANGGTPASAEAALLAGIAAGRAYLNIHSAAFPGGEIRDFLLLVPPSPPIPTPTLSQWVLGVLALLLAAGAVVALRRRRA